MSSPYVAGLCALLVSDAMQRDPDVKVRQFDVKRALCESGRMLPGTTQLDLGFGVPDINEARRVLAELIEAARGDPCMGYEISTYSPSGPEGRGTAAYWRSTYFPTQRAQTFTIKPFFMPGSTGPERTGFTRRFELRSNTSWCQVAQEHVYLRSGQNAYVRVEYEAAMRDEPGLYVGTVDGVYEGRVAFRLVNTVVVPHRFRAEEDYTQRFSGVVRGWLPERYFVAVPPGASAMNMTLRAPEGVRSLARIAQVCNPAGEFRRGRAALDTDDQVREAELNLSEKLTPGVWEVDILSPRMEDEHPYELEVRFFGLVAEPQRIIEWSHPSGSTPSSELMVTNLFERYAPADVEGKLEGYRKQVDAEFEGYQDTITQSINIDDSIRAVRVRIEMTPEDYAKTTDVGVMITDASGKALLETGLGMPEEEHTIPNPTPNADSTSLTLHVRAAFAAKDEDYKSPMTIKIDRLYAQPIRIEVSGPGDQMAFVPGIPTELSFKLVNTPPAAPDGMRPVGNITFRERGSADAMLHVPIDIGS
jgi:hypothetical protein